MNKLLIWELVQVKPVRSRIETLKLWFETSALLEKTRATLNTRRLEISRQAALDSISKLRQNKAKYYYWRAKTAEMLISIHEVAKSFAYQLRQLGLPNAWLMQNCRPGMGNWIRRKDLVVSLKQNPVGYPCRIFCCPWCWDRQISNLTKLCRSSTNETVTFYSGYKRFGLGFGDTVNTVSVSLAMENSIPNKQLIRELKERCNALLFSSGSGPVFDTALWVFCPLWGSQGPAGGRFVWVSTGSAKLLPLPDKLVTSGGVATVRCSYGAIPALQLRKELPFPVQVYDLPPAQVLPVAKTLKGKRMYGVVRYRPKATTPKSPVETLQKRLARMLAKPEIRQETVAAVLSEVGAACLKDSSLLTSVETLSQYLRAARHV